MNLDFAALDFARGLMPSPRHWGLVLATRRLHRMCYPGQTDADFLRHLADTCLDPIIRDAATTLWDSPLTGLWPAELRPV